MAYGTLNIDNLTSSDGGVISPNINSLRNRIINGAMVIDQRNAGASVTPTSATFSLDRWNTNLTQSSKFSVQQNAGSVTPPVGFKNYLGVTSLSAYSVLSSDFFALQQPIEGFNFADLDWGTANAQTVTLSFRVRSSLTGTFGGSLVNSAFDRSYPYTYTISAANTWETKSITIAGDTTGTWVGATNGIGCRLYFGLGAGSTYSGTAGAWSANAFTSATGATSVVGTNGATFYITGVQLEKGSTATSFDYRPYGTEFALCQRYYVKFYPGAYGPLGIGVATSTTAVSTIIQLPVTFRTKPTGITLAGEAFNATSGSPTGITYDQATVNAIMPYVNGTGFTSGNVVSIRGGGAGTTTLSIDGGEL
jgi:hypothetical protein